MYSLCSLRVACILLTAWDPVQALQKEQDKSAKLKAFTADRVTK